MLIGDLAINSCSSSAQTLVIMLGVSAILKPNTIAAALYMCNKHGGNREGVEITITHSHFNREHKN